LKLSSNEVAKHLAKAIHSIYFISGAEDLLIIESLDQIRKAAITMILPTKLPSQFQDSSTGVRLIIVSKTSLYSGASNS